MKKVVSLLVCFIMLLGCAQISVSATMGPDLLGYGSFEARPERVWTAAYSKGSYTDEIAHTGNISVKIKEDKDVANTYLYFTLNSEIKNHETYCLSMYVYSAKSDGFVTLTPRIMYYIDGKLLEVKDQTRTFSSGKWIKYEHNFVIDEQTTGEITSPEIRVDIENLRDVYFDDVELRKGAADIKELEFDYTEPEKIEVKGDTLNLYVDQSAAKGGDGSEAKPFDSIYTARDYVRTINKDMKENITVNIKGGFYEISETFSLTEEDSGSNGYKVVWQAAPGEKVTISGGVRKTGWVESEIPGVYKTHHEGDNLRSLYVNDEVAKRARLDDYILPISWYDDKSDKTTDKDGFIIPKGIIKNPEAATNLEAFKSVTFKCAWAVKGRAFECEEGTVLAFHQPEFYWHERAAYLYLKWDIEDNFRLENALEFLDEPGEWFQDIDTDTLYYMPKEGENIHESEIVAPVLERMVEIEGQSVDNKAHDIVFRDIIFANGANDRTSNKGRQTLQSCTYQTYENPSNYGTANLTDPAAIVVANASRILFEKTVVKNMSSNGINMTQGVDNSEVNGSAFYNIASGAFTAGAPTNEYPIDVEVLPRNITFSNNILTKIAYEYSTSGATQVFFVNGIFYLNNVVYDVGYSGLCAGWSWGNMSPPIRRVTYIGNRIWNTNTLGKDGSCIYTLGPAPDSTLQYNYVSAVPGGDYWQCIYHDNVSSYFYDYRNIVNSGEHQTSTNNWISPYQPQQTGTVLIENYTTYPKRSFRARDTVETKTECNPGASWSEAARYAISQSGLSDGYEYLYDIVPNWEEQHAIKHVTLQTEEQGNAAPILLKSGQSVNLKTLYELFNGELYFKEEYSKVESSDTSVVKCNGRKITAVGAGAAMVNAVTADGHEISIPVTVDDEVVKLTIHPFEAYETKTVFAEGDSTYLRYSLATKYWEHTDVDTEHEFISSNPHIATVNDMGEIRMLRNGYTKITLKVKYDGKIYEATYDINVGGKTVEGSVVLDKYIYEVSEGNELKASLIEKGNKSALTADNIIANYENISKESLDASVAEIYTAGMLYSFGKGIIDSSWHPKDNLTEKDFLTMVEKATGRTGAQMDIKIKDGYITRERMAYILVKAIRHTWAQTMLFGSSRLNHISDRKDVTPELIPYVAGAVAADLFVITESVKQFRPKAYGTMEEAATTIHRLLEPQLIRTVEHKDYEFSKAYWEEQNSRNGLSAWRYEVNKTPLATANQSSVDGSTGILPEPGDYKVTIKSIKDGQVIEGTDYCYVYDKNDIMKSDEYTTAAIGKLSSGMFLEKDGEIRMIGETGNVFNNDDSFLYAYKKAENPTGDFEYITTVSGVAETASGVAAGIMARTSLDSDSPHINYRIRPSGELYFCWRDAKGGSTGYSVGNKISFPATLKLVKKGVTFEGYYLEAGKWVKQFTSTLPALEKIDNMGLMFYSLTTNKGAILTGKPGAASFRDTQFNYIKDNGIISGEQITETPKPEETTPSTPVETPEEVKFEINRNKYIDVFENGNFNKGITGWGYASGKLYKSSVAYGGKAALGYDVQSSGSINYYLSPINNRKTYYLIFKAKTESGTVNLLPYIQYYNGTEWVRANATLLTDMKVDSNGWKEYAVELTFVGEVTTPQLVINVSGSASVFFDNMELLHN